MNVFKGIGYHNVCVNLVGFAALWIVLSLCGFAMAQTSIEDSRGVQSFDGVPKKVVALSWSGAEQLIELGVIPVGVADLAGYSAWVVQPALDEAIVDVGTRSEPNLEAIAELEPDVILISDDQIDFANNLEKIAPVVHFDAFSEDHDNVDKAIEIYTKLAALLGKAEYAEKRLKAQEEKLTELSAQLNTHFNGELPRVTIIRLLDDSTVAIYGDNAMSTYVLDAFNIQGEYPVGQSTWGLAVKKNTDLRKIREGYVMNILPFDQAGRLYKTKLWRSLPFVKANRYKEIPPVWTYGGALSVTHLAELIAESLLQIDPVSQ